DLSVPRRVGIDHAAPMAAIRAQPDGLFLSPQLDTDAAYGRQAADDDRGARRRSTSGGRNCWRSGAVLVATTTSLSRHHDLVRTGRAGRRLDRICGIDLASG